MPCQLVIFIIAGVSADGLAMLGTPNKWHRYRSVTLRQRLRNHHQSNKSAFPFLYIFVPLCVTLLYHNCGQF